MSNAVKRGPQPLPARTVGAGAVGAVGVVVVLLLLRTAAAAAAGPVGSPAPPVSPSNTPAAISSSPTPEGSPSPLPPASVGLPLDEVEPLLETESPAVAASPDATTQVTPEQAEEIRQEIIHGEDQTSGLSVIDDIVGEAVSPGEANLSNYELGASVDVVDRIFVAQARLLFTLGTSVIALAGWVLQLVLRFDLGSILATDIGTLAGQYARLIDGQPVADGVDSAGLPLKELMLTIAVAHAGWQIFRHRSHAAAAELLVALIIALTGGLLLTNAETSACAGLNVMGDLTLGMMALGSLGTDVEEVAPGNFCDRDAPRSTPTTEVVDRVMDTFVHEPFLLLQWGTVPPRESACRIVADALVQKRAWDNADEPRQRMEEAGCTEMAQFNARMSANRLAATAAYTLTSTAFAVAVILSAGTLLVAQVAGALLVLAMPFAVTVGIAPGAGRELLARWFHSLLQITVLFMGSGFFLSLLMTSVDAVQRGTQDDPIVVRMVVAVVVAWSLVILRGRIFRSLRFAARGVSRRAAGPAIDVGGPGRGPAAITGGAAIRTAAAAADIYAGGAAARAGLGAAATVAAGVGGAATDAGRDGGSSPSSVARASRLRRHHVVATRPDGHEE